MTPANHYRYTIQSRRGIMQVQPLGESDFKLTWGRQEKDKLDYKQELPSKIIFTGAAYATLLTLEKSVFRCDYITITVERHCGEQWTTIFPGRLSLNDGTWDLDRCEVELQLDDIKPEQCFEDNKTKELNLLDGIVTRREIFLNGTNITVEKVEYSFDSGLLPPFTPGDTSPYWNGVGTPAAGGWYAWSHYWEILRFNEYVFGYRRYRRTTKWARETTLINCADPAPGPEWILIEDTCPGGQRKYARPVRVYNCKHSASDPGLVLEWATDICTVVGDDSFVASIDNGIPLEDVLEFFVNSFCPGYNVVSNFFQINPDTISTVNYVTGQPSKTRFITLFQKSDVKRPGAVNNATQAKLSWEKIMRALVEMFNVRWRIIGTEVRIEHVSYFGKALGLDLTQPKYAKWMVGKRKYSYDKTNIPAKEEFKFMEADYGDFQGVPIIYNGGCVSKASRDQVETHALDFVTTDLEFVLSHPDPDSNQVADEGFVFIAASFDGTNYTTITEAAILGRASLNNPLAWAQLHRDYHKWDRALSSGIMNNLQTTFFTVRPTKKGTPITIPFCCGDTFDPDNLVKTFLGVGVIDKAVFSFRDETLELDILYNADKDLTSNRAPVAVNDVVDTYVNVAADFNVIGNDTDPDPGFILSGVQIVVPPIHGTATVNPDNTVHYVPDWGYVGDDAFVYTVLDEWSQPSNNALVSINVHPANTAPVAVMDHYFAQKNTTLNVPAPGVFTNDSDDVAFTLDTFDALSVQGGAVTVNGDGSFSYDPPAGYAGPDSFTYTIKDTPGLTSVATVNIDVLDPDNPLATDDKYQTRKNQVLIVAAPGIVFNDLTNTGPVTAVPGVFATTQGGSVDLAADGSFVYTPPANFVGLDDFDYTADNGTGTDTATVYIDVVNTVFMRIQKVADDTQAILGLCGFPPVGTILGTSKIATFRLYFYENAGGTIPMDVTGLGITANLQINGLYSGGGGYTTPFTAGPLSGDEFDVLVNYEYFRDERTCHNAVVVYKNETISLEPGLYTVI